MKASIHQPAYLPWLGYFHKIAVSDIFIFFDTAQFEKNSYINRNKIKTPTGPQWLTVPVETKGKFKKNELRYTRIVNREDWQRKHWLTIEQNYAKAPQFAQHYEKLQIFYNEKWIELSELCWKMLRYFLDVLSIETPLVRASELMGITGKKTDLIVSLCQSVGASHYISGRLGRNYIDESSFFKEGITLSYQDFIHPHYSQLYGEFVSNLSIIDMLFNCPVSECKQIFVEK